MSYLFGSPASFIDSVGDESEYYNESDKVRVD